MIFCQFVMQSWNPVMKGFNLVHGMVLLWYSVSLLCSLGSQLWRDSILLLGSFIMIFCHFVMQSWKPVMKGFNLVNGIVLLWYSVSLLCSLGILLWKDSILFTGWFYDDILSVCYAVLESCYKGIQSCSRDSFIMIFCPFVMQSWKSVMTGFNLVHGMVIVIFCQFVMQSWNPVMKGFNLVHFLENYIIFYHHFAESLEGIAPTECLWNVFVSYNLSCHSKFSNLGMYVNENNLHETTVYAE